MRFGEGLGHLLELAVHVVGTEVDGRAHAHGAEVGGLAHRGEHDLVVGVGHVQECVVVQPHDERDAVHVLARGQTEHAQHRRHGRALTGQGELEQVERVEVDRALGERGGGGVLDALVDGKDGEVPGAGQPPVVEHAPEVAQHRGRAVAVGEDRVEVVRSGEGQASRGKALAV